MQGYPATQGQSIPNQDLANIPESMRSGLRVRPRQYDPREFGLSGVGEWRDPRLFCNMTYDTDAATLEELRRVNQPTRQAYDPPVELNLRNLPEECLDDISPPGLDLSMPSEMFPTDCLGEGLASGLPPQPCDVSSFEAPVGGQEASSYVDTVYAEIVNRLKSLRHRIARGDHTFQSEVSLISSESTPNDINKCGEMTVSRCPHSTGHQNKTRRVFTNRDRCGTILGNTHEEQQRLDDIQPPSLLNAADMGAQSLHRTPAALPSHARGRRLNFNLTNQSENLDEISMPSYHEATPPAMSTRIGQQVPGQLDGFGTEECFDEVGAPSLAYSGAVQPGNTTIQDICDITPPSFVANGNQTKTNECLPDITMHSFGNVLGASRRPQALSIPSQYLEDMSGLSFNGTVSRSTGPTSAQGLSTNQDCLQDISMSSYGGISGDFRNRGQRLQSTEVLEPLKKNCDISPSTFGSSRQRLTYNECLEDFSMPSFGGISVASTGKSPQGHQVPIPSEVICDVSAPSFIRQDQATDKYLEDMSIPSFGGISVGSRVRSYWGQHQVTMPSQNIAEISSPFFDRSSRGPAYNEGVKDISMPSCGGVSGGTRSRPPQRPKLSMPSQNIFDVSPPSFGANSRSLGDIPAPSCAEYRMQVTLPSECIDNVTGPSFERSRYISSAQTTQQTKTSQNMFDASAPSFSNSTKGPSHTADTAVQFGSFLKSPQRQQMLMPLETIYDISFPSFGGPGQISKHFECLEDLSMPPFGSISGAGSSQPQQGPMRSTNKLEPSTDECLEDMSIPLFADISGARNPRIQQVSLPSQNILDISAPSFGTASRGPVPSECLEDATVPSFGGNSDAVRRQLTLPSECIDDISAFSLGRSGSPCATSRCGQRTDPIHAISTRKLPSSSRRTPMTTELLNDMSIPTFGEVSGVNSGRRHVNLPNERLCDVTAPSFATGSPGATCECLDGNTALSPEQNLLERAWRHRQQCMPSENKRDISVPSVEFLEEMSRPLFNEVSSASNARSPVFTSLTRNREMPNECLADIPMPSFGGISGASGITPHQRQLSMPECSLNIGDITAPSFNTSSLGHKTIECQNDMTMPSFSNVRGAPRKQVTLPVERFDKVSGPPFVKSTIRRANLRRTLRNRHLQDVCIEPAPFFANSDKEQKTKCLENMSMPSFGGDPVVFRQRSRRKLQGPIHSQNICDVSAPVFLPSPWEAATNKCLNDVSLPSLGGFLGIGTPRRNISRSPGIRRALRNLETRSTLARTGEGNECLENVTMPSFGEVSATANLSLQSNECPPRKNNDLNVTSFRQNSIDSSSRLQRQRSVPANLPSECLDDVSAPNFDLSGGSRTPRTPLTINERLQDISMPSMQQTPSLRRNRSLPCIPEQLQRIADISAPSMASSVSNRHRSQLYNCSYPSEQLENVSAPFRESGFPKESNQTPAWNENTTNRRENASRPLFEDISYPPRRHQLTMPSENLNDVVEPTLVGNYSSPRYISSVPNAQVEDASQSLFYTLTTPMTQSDTDMMDSRNGNLNDLHIPAKSTTSIHQVSSEQKVTRQVFKQLSSDNIDDESAPSILHADEIQSPGLAAVAGVVDEVEKVTVKTSSSITRVYTKSNEPKKSSGQGNIPIPSLPGQNGGPSTGYLLEGPDQQLTTITYENHMQSPSLNLQGGPQAHSSMYIMDVSEPLFSPSYEASHENGYDDTETTAEANNTTRFDSMENYVPFDDLDGSQETRQTRKLPPESGAGHSQGLGRGQCPEPPVPGRETARRTPGNPCNMIITNYPYGKPHCITRGPC